MLKIIAFFIFFALAMPAGGCNDGWMAALTVALEDCSAIFF